MIKTWALEEEKLRTYTYQPQMRDFVYCKKCNLVTHYTMYSYFKCNKCKGDDISDVPNGIFDCQYPGSNKSIKVEFLNGKFLRDITTKNLVVMEEPQEFQLSPQNPRDLANCMIDQLIEYAKINDTHYQKMMCQLGHVPAADGDDCIVNGLKNLKELIQKI